MSTYTDRLANRPPGLLERARSSINSPSLMGERGAGIRFARIQWFVILWRYITLAQIPVLVAISPDSFVSSQYALIYFSFAMVYTLTYSWLATRTGAAGTWYFHVTDMLVCGALLLTAHEATLLYIITFYTYTCLVNRPTLLKRETIPGVIALSFVFLLATFITVNPFFTTSVRVGEFIVYYFWAAAILVATNMLSHASALELDDYLEKQRQGYRRSLHDDLGNTLCGLHYKIQSLKLSGGDELKQALAFLNRGYQRANGVLGHLLDEIDEIADEDLREALERIVLRAREEFGLKVELTTPASEINVSPAVKREVVSIVREALANAAKHSGAESVSLDLSRRNRRLTVSISDSGAGFDPSGLKNKQELGCIGIKGMRERAAMINGRFHLSSSPQSGTSVTFSFEEQKAGQLAGRLAWLRNQHPDHIYSFFIYLKMSIALLILLEVGLMEPELSAQPVVWLTTAVIMVDAAAFFLFPDRLYRLLTARPWLLAVEMMIFSLLTFAAWSENLPLFFDSAPTMAVVFSACFLGTTGNLALASLLSLGMVVANLLAPAPALMHAERMEELVINIFSNLLLALLAGLAVEFVRNLEGLQQNAIARALAQQRERLTRDTHRQLSSRVQAVGDDIQSLMKSGGDGRGAAERFGSLETRSNELKSRLREILRSLDSPAEETE